MNTTCRLRCIARDSKHYSNNYSIVFSGQLMSTREFVGRQLYGTPSGCIGTKEDATSSGMPAGYTTLIICMNWNAIC